MLYICKAFTYVNALHHSGTFFFLLLQVKAVIGGEGGGGGLGNGWDVFMVSAAATTNFTAVNLLPL